MSSTVILYDFQLRFRMIFNCDFAKLQLFFKSIKYQIVFVPNHKNLIS